MPDHVRRSGIIQPDYRASDSLYLDASVDARAMRRWLECQNQGRDDHYDAILESMKERDRLDSMRLVAPLRPADDALVIDTTGVEEQIVYTRVLELVRQVKNVK